MTIGERLRRERKRAGLTQAELALALDVHHAYVWKIENGKRRPSKRLIDRWSAATASTQADLLLEGPALFDLAFPIDRRIDDPFTARRVLDVVPAGVRKQVSVWPSSNETVLRLRARGSALPSAIGLAGTTAPGIGQLGTPTVSPLRAADELVAWIRAADERHAAEQVEARMAAAAARGCVTIGRFGAVFVARVAALSKHASVALQDLVEESPIGLFVPAAW